MKNGKPKTRIMRDDEVVELVQALELATQNVDTFYGPNREAIENACLCFLYATRSMPIVRSGMDGRVLHRSKVSSWKSKCML